MSKNLLPPCFAFVFVFIFFLSRGLLGRSRSELIRSPRPNLSPGDGNQLPRHPSQPLKLIHRHPLRPLLNHAPPSLHIRHLDHLHLAALRSHTASPPSLPIPQHPQRYPHPLHTHHVLCRHIPTHYHIRLCCIVRTYTDFITTLL